MNLDILRDNQEFQCFHMEKEENTYYRVAVMIKWNNAFYMFGIY